MREIFASLPLKSPEDILDSVYREEKSQIPELEQVLEKEFHVDKYLASLTKNDPLTDRIYQKDKEGRILYPAKEGDALRQKQLLRERLGYQENLYHKETIPENIRSTVERMVRNTPEGESRHEMALLGLLSQGGKKYTAISTDKMMPSLPGEATRKRQMGFDEHEKVSAYLAARRYQQIGLDKERARPFVTAIFHQNEPRRNWEKRREEKASVPWRKDTIHPSKKTIYQEKYGDRTVRITETLSKATKGYLTKDDVRKAYTRLERGEEIIRTQVLEYAGRRGLSPVQKDDLLELEEAKIQKREEDRLQLDRKNREFQTNERLRLEREAVERERERQAWIAYEKEKEEMFRHLMDRGGRQITRALIGTAVGRVIGKEMRAQQVLSQRTRETQTGLEQERVQDKEVRSRFKDFERSR